MGDATTKAATSVRQEDEGALASALRTVPLFAPMPEGELADFARRGEAFGLEAGAYVAREGEPAEWFFVLLEGEIRITKRTGAEERLLDIYQAGTYFGEVPILIGGPYVASGRATRRCRLFRLRSEDFLHLLGTCEWTLREILRTMARRVLNLQAFAQGQARLAALGTLAAGLAHELNNPAAAGRRAAGQLRPSVATLQVRGAALGPERLARVRGLATEAAASAAPALDPLAASDREEALAVWLDERGVEEGWELAPALAGAGLDAARLAALADDVGAEAFPAAVGWLAATLATGALLDAVEASATRVSDLVGAMDGYTSLDRGPVQAVDVEEGLESTLAVLGHRLGDGVRVVRAYGRGVPRLEANGGELNQVWTNLLENAIDAIGERGDGGEIRVATGCDGAGVVVEIADDGPGIPEAVRGRVFEPFFTTKPPGQGTGLGLDTVRRIVERHDGDVRIESRPGETRVRVWLPLAGAAAAGDGPRRRGPMAEIPRVRSVGVAERGGAVAVAAAPAPVLPRQTPAVGPRLGGRGRSRRAWVRPPRLRTVEGAGERHASWLELFFDLVFVVAIAKLAHELVLDHSAAGFARFAALFVPVFVAWQGFSIYADRFDTDDVVFRLFMLAAMLAIVALAIQIPDVVHGVSGGFALAYAGLRALTVGLYLRAYRHVPPARALIVRYARGIGASVLLWTVSIAVPPPWRFVLWGVGLAIDLMLPPLSTGLIRGTPISTRHLPERFGLFTIIVLGESVISVALGTLEGEWRPVSVAAATVGFLVVACLWWVYFDVGADLSLPPGSIGVPFAYAHLPLLGALVAVGAGVSLLIEEAGGRHLDAGARWALGGGTALFLGAVTVAQWEMIPGVPPGVVQARLVAVAALATMAAAAEGVRPIVFAGGLLALLVALVVFEFDRHPDLAAETTPAPVAAGHEHA